MNTIDRSQIIDIARACSPQLAEHFDGVLVNKSYTVEELNTIFRYVLAQADPDSLYAREWLCSAGDPGAWLHFFRLNVLPKLNSIRSASPWPIIAHA